MTATTTKTSIHKAARVIASCRSPEQVEVAGVYLRRLLTSMRTTMDERLVKIYERKLLMRLQLLNRKILSEI